MEVIMKIYFTFRYLNVGREFYSPQYVFDNAFIGLPFIYKYICGDPSKDGRHLAVVEYNGDILESEIRDLLKEALSLYAYHEKTPEKVLEFVKYITGLDDSKVYFDNDNIVIKYPDLEKEI
jgi:hypothetical protein